MLIVGLLALLGSVEEDVSPPAALGRENPKGLITIDYTNTVVYRVETSMTMTFGPTVFPGETIARSGSHAAVTNIARYYSTILVMHKLMTVSATPTGSRVPVQEMKPLKSVFFKPAILIGATGGCLLLVSLIWPARWCRRRVRPLPQQRDASARGHQPRKKSNDKVCRV
jgi:hypothetical protein